MGWETHVNHHPESDFEDVLLNWTQSKVWTLVCEAFRERMVHDACTSQVAGLMCIESCSEEALFVCLIIETYIYIYTETQAVLFDLQLGFWFWG